MLLSMKWETMLLMHDEALKYKNIHYESIHELQTF